ncbi:MAG: TIR domain-containing protein, partial [Gammaproteobacteria bacterium]|nr:TIR domain-containing protein [Gammaproteobacteria bacterium]
MTDVFISYASDDRASVEPIVRALESHGLSVWWDRNIDAGTAFDREIEAAIEAARCIVVVWTKRSVQSDWVRAEATEGLQRGVLVPIVLGDARPPMVFRATQAILIDGQIEDFSAILRAVDRFVPEDRTQRRSPPDQDSTAATVADVDMAARTDAGPRSRNRRIALAAVIIVMVAGLGWLLSLRSEPDAAVATDMAATDMQRIVILPFVVRGNNDLDYLSEGVVDLLAIRLDGIAGYHGIDAFTSLTKARSQPGSSTDPQMAMLVAREVGAGRFVMGAVVDAGDAAVISATIYDLDANATSRAEVDYRGNAIEAIDELTRLLIASELSAPYESFASMAALTTRSVDALKAYLEGERLFRFGDFRASVHQFQEAIRHDENFALAWFKMSLSAVFVDRDLVIVAEARANELRDQLSVPQRELLRGYGFGGSGRIVEARAVGQALTTAYPDNVEAWRFLGEIQFRLNLFSGRDTRDSAASFEEILAIDPDDHWSRMYLVDIALGDADAAAM